jgi:DNA-damage-inducible protein J
MQQATSRKSTEIRSRIEPDLKEQSTVVLASLGLDMSDAIRLFLRQVVAVQGLPFEVRKPAPATVAAMIEAREMGPARFASTETLFDELKRKPNANKARKPSKKI